VSDGSPLLDEVLDPIELVLPPAPPAAAPLAAPRLEWQPRRDGPRRAMVDVAGRERGWLDLGELGSRLAEAEVLDTRSVPVAGAFVMLPHGVRLADRLAELVEAAYRDCGLEKYEYGNLVPVENIEAAQAVLDLRDGVFWAYDARSLEAGRPFAALCPSGEEVIYLHWKRMIRSRHDLPLQVFRRCSYFRSTGGRNGLGILRSPELRDMFELHACFAEREQAREAMARYLAALRGLAAQLHLPMVFSSRPPWGNRCEVSEATVGGDVPLPCGSTLQTACLYLQGQRFSRALGVGFREGGRLHATEQVTGAVSRRLLFAHLMLGMHDDGGLLVHPVLAPDEVELHFVPEAADEQGALASLVRELRDDGLRVGLREVGQRRQLARLRRSAERRGVPVVVLVLGRRGPGDPWKLVVTRADTGEEATIHADTLGPAIRPWLRPTLVEIGHAYHRRAHGFLRRQLAGADDEATLREGLAERRVVLCPMVPTRVAMARIAAWSMGEVLGFVRDQTAHACVVTGTATAVRAVISPRI
jgi:hypothetical protein